MAWINQDSSRVFSELRKEKDQLAYLGLLTNNRHAKMGGSSSRRTRQHVTRQHVRLEDIPTWTEDFSKNGVELATYVASSDADNATRKPYSVDLDLNNRVSLYKGDITCIEADGIVSCNNNRLETTGGISSVIEKAAGNGLTKELAKLNGCQVGEAKVTAGYDMPVKYIVHTVGPQDANETLLDKCYSSCLARMTEKQMGSLVFCCISTGSFGFPKEKAAEVALKRVRLWLEDRKKSQPMDTIGRIIFCLFTPNDVSAYKAWMQIYFPCGSEEDYAKWMMQQRISNLQPLDGFIEITTTEPDMISYENDPQSKRAKMPCGHVIGPESMTEYCTGILDDGKYSFPCPDPGCDVDWQYFLVRHVACLTASQMQEFETKISANFLRKEDEVARKCPGCDIPCSRRDKTNTCVMCLYCSKKNGSHYLFCWKCLGTWNSGNWKTCGNIRCHGMDNRVEILASCPNKLILDKFDAPSVRGCPKCGLLIEYLRWCTQMHCRGCHHFFCFLCLQGAKTKKELKCDPYKSTCKIALRQTELPGI